MGKKQDAAGVKVEVEKQTAAIRRLAQSLRDEASDGSWLSNYKGRHEILTGTAQTLDGIADALTFAVNNDPAALPKLNKVFRQTAAGVLFLVGGAAATTVNETVKELDIPAAIADALTSSNDATTRVEQAMAGVDAAREAGPTEQAPSNAATASGARTPSDTTTGQPWRSDHFETSVRELVARTDLSTLRRVVFDPNLVTVEVVDILGSHALEIHFETAKPVEQLWPAKSDPIPVALEDLNSEVMLDIRQYVSSVARRRWAKEDT